MKTRYSAILIISLLTVSCSLKEKMEGIASRETSYHTSEQAKAIVNNCYRYINFQSTNYGLMVEACTDIWYASASNVDANCDISPTQPGIGSTVWNNCWTGVMSCNEAIECICNSGLNDVDKYPLQAEARVLRALYYYYLTNVFNGVPFYLNMIKDQDDLKKVAVLPRTSAEEIRRTLYEDLRDNAIPYFTEENGLKKRTSEVSENRAGYALGLMMMAKFAMWNKDWDGAIAALTKLEALYGELTEARYPLNDTKWSIKNTDESIFELQHAWSTTGVQYTSSYGRFMLPKYDGDGVFDGVYMPEYVSNNLSSWGCVYATPHYGAFRTASGNVKQETSSSTYTKSLFRPLPLTYDEYNADINRYTTKIDMNGIKQNYVRGEKLDRRTLYILGLGKLSTGDTFTRVKEQGLTYGGEKFWCPGMVSSYDSNNYKLFRYADAVLMMAECWCMKGDFTQAHKYINYTRVRAGVDPIEGFNNEEGFMLQLRNERARELGGELHRKFDLVRWGIWYEETRTYTSNSKLKNTMKPYHRYYPIPATQCALSGYALDNPEYTQE